LHLFCLILLLLARKELANMKIKPITKIVSLIFLLLCVGCTVVLSPAKPEAPQEGEAPLSLTQVYISTQVATLETLIAQLTAEAQISPTLEPTQTATLTGTATATSISTPTLTLAPFPTAVPTLIPYPTKSSTPSAYQCEIFSQSPTKRSFAPNEDFDARWSVYNTGTSNWEASNFDYQHLAGERMDKRGAIFDLPSTIEPGKKLDILVDMKAPGQPGRYTTTWGVASGSLIACRMDLVIYVR
jgi:hypothetical protein